jgi:hypothetical protein
MTSWHTGLRALSRPTLALVTVAAMLLAPSGAVAQTAAETSAADVVPRVDDVVRSSFDDRPTGPFVRGTAGWDVDVITGNAVNVVSVPSAEDRSVRISRTTGTGSTGSALARVFETPLTGTVSVSARVMRSDSEGGFFGLPYVYDEAGRPTVSVALARGNIVAYEGTTSRTVGQYEPGRWYDVDLTVDTDAQTFDLAIDGEVVFTDAAPRTPLTGISRIAWYANGAERGAVHVDDVAISRTGFVADAVTYYVSAEGDDTAAGTSSDAAWRSLEKVGATTFAPGDRILLRAGDTWTGQLWPKGSGVPGHPITIDSYGDGPKPRIAGEGAVAEAVRLFNQEYWVVRNLDISNAAPSTGTPGENLKDLRGIGVVGDSGTILDHIVIDAVDVHDVTGEINWIGGNPANDSPGVNWGTGWDRSKNTGGIVFRATVADPAAPGRATVLTDLTVQDSTIKNTSFAGITVKQWTGNDADSTTTGWGTRRTADDVRFTPHTDITIRGNYLTQADTEYGANGVYLTNARDALIEGNLVDRVGVSGIETFTADRVTVQHNEIAGTKWTQGSADANGMDPDIATTNQLFQYNYLHGNGDGILLCACNGNHPFGSAVVRYNVVVDSGRWNLHMSQTSGSVAHVYNNTFVSSEAPNMVSGSVGGTVTLTNNLFASSRSASFMDNSRVTYTNNAYSPELTAPGSDTAALVGDPRFVDPERDGPFGDEASGPRLETAGAFGLRSDSPFIDMGAPVDGNGGQDFAGTPVPSGEAPEVGAFEYTTPSGQTTESVRGTVTNQYGLPVPDADVTVTVDGETHTATTGSDGSYTILAVPFATDAPVTVTAADHATHQGTLTVATGSPTRYDVELTTTVTTGSVVGRVVDESAAPVPDAVVTVTADGTTTGTATSAQDGTFRIGDVAAGEGYTVVASAPGRTGLERTGVRVTPTAVVDVGGLYLVSGAAESLVDESFDALPTGALADGTNGWSVVATGNAVDVVAVPSESDKSARLTRTTGEGGTAGTNLARTFATPVEGLVTIEAEVMRDDDQAGWFGLPYVYNASGQPAVTVAFARGDIIAYEGSTSRTLGTYQRGRWYHVAITIDTVNQRFDLEIDGERLVTGAAFRNQMPGIARVAWYANGGERGAVHVDDVRIVRGVQHVSEPRPAVTAKAVPACVGKQVNVTVQAVNDDSIPIDVIFTTPYGERTVRNVAPGGMAQRAFAARAASIEAGVVTVTATGVIDGVPTTLEQEVDLPSLACAGSAPQDEGSAVVYVDEAFDTQTDPPNFGFATGAQVVDGVLRVTEGMENYTTSVSTFDSAVRAERTLDLTFDWKTDIASTGMKTGLELRDSAGALVFGLAATGAELRYGVTGPVSDSSAAPDSLNPAWTKIAFDRTKWYTVDLHMDFTVGTVQYTISTREASPRVMASGTGRVTATNLDRLVACNYYGVGPQSVDNVLLRRPAHTADGLLQGKSVYAFGDSIVAGHKYSRGFVNLVAEREGIAVTKYARNGATVMDAGYPAGTVVEQVRAASGASPDLVVFDGGTNDIEAITAGQHHVGSVSSGFDPAGFDSGTYAGALEATVHEMRSKWPDASIVYVAVHKLGSRDWETQLAVRDVTLQVAEKWGLTVADVFADSTLDTRDDAQRVAYTFNDLVGAYPGSGGSGTHPNIEGMTRFYVPVLTGALIDVVRSVTGVDGKPKPGRKV